MSETHEAPAVEEKSVPAPVEKMPKAGRGPKRHETRPDGSIAFFDDEGDHEGVVREMSALREKGTDA